METYIKRHLGEPLDSTKRIQYYLWLVDEVEQRQLELRAKKQAILQRIDALEAQLQALKKGSKSPPTAR